MRRRPLAPLLASCLVSAAWALAPGDAAAQVTAVPCAADPLTCLDGPIAFTKTKEALPVSGGFDTGWIPQGSPLQVHLAAGLWAETEVSLEGQLRTSWPEVLEQRAIGTPGGGALGIHYGVEITAEAKFEVVVLGQTFTWQGDIPYVPQFDFQVEQEQAFDPWAFDGFTVSGVTDQQTLAQVDLADMIGIPGVSGGFELDVALELDARYQTTFIHVDEIDGTPVAGGPIVSEGAATRADYAGGPAVEHDVQVEGALVYDGTLHLIPAFFIEVLGQSFSIPIADFPVPFTIEDKEWVFDPVRVHTPLPDIDLPLYAGSDVVSFGDVAIGERREVIVSFDNVGEHLLSVQLVLPDGTPVELPADPIAVAPDGTAEVVIAYEPVDEGPLDAILVLASNDPDEPARTLSLVGNGLELPDGEGGSSGEGGGGAGGDAEGGAGGGGVDAAGGGDAANLVASGSGCSCRTTAGSPRGVAGSVALVVVAAALARRARRRR